MAGDVGSDQTAARLTCRWTMASGSRGDNVFKTLVAVGSPVGGLVGLETFSAALGHPRYTRALSSDGAAGLQAPSRTSGPHELVCSHSSFSQGRKSHP